MSDLVKRIKDACVGHPHAKIAWPHYLLHEAASEIESLRARVAELEAEREQPVKVPDKLTSVNVTKQFGEQLYNDPARLNAFKYGYNTCREAMLAAQED